MIRPEIYLLRQIQWQTFNTLTFKGKLRSDTHMHGALHTWLRAVAKSYRIPDRFLLWASRQELGELYGRPHFHVLLGGVASLSNRTTLRDLHRIRMMWARQFGFAVVRTFENGADGIDYLCKESLTGISPEATGLQLAALNSDRSKSGADGYELSKYGGNAAKVAVGTAVWRKLERSRGREFRPANFRQFASPQGIRPAA